MGANEPSPNRCSLVPMTYEDVVHGVVVVSKRGRDRFDADDETTFAIFAELRGPGPGQRRERRTASSASRPSCEHQLASQRRLLEVNERLLSTLEPSERPRPDRRFAQGRSSRTTR